MNNELITEDVLDLISKLETYDPAGVSKFTNALSREGANKRKRSFFL
jgi:hypothetical protein